MLIKVEYFIEFSENLSSKMYDETLAEFNLILNNLYNAKRLSFPDTEYDQKSQTIAAMKGHYNHFKIGWGANHMWVHQVIENVTIPHRLLIVEF